MVGQRTKTYVVQKFLRGKTVRITIGHHGILTAEQARKEAIKLLADMERGIDPRDKKHTDLVPRITLGIAFVEYLEARKSLNPPPFEIINIIWQDPLLTGRKSVSPILPSK